MTSSNVKISARGQVAAAVATLGKKIVGKQFAVGATLPVEQDLADQLGVGRNALREAVKVLSGKGLLKTAPRSGTRVRPREDWNMLDPDVLEWHADPATASVQFMLDITEMRHIIEPMAAKLAAERATREDVAEIMALFEQMDAASNDSLQRMEADIAFHSAILKATHNVVLTNFKHAVSTYLRAHFFIVQEDAQLAEDDLQRHRDLAWAIASGDGDKAMALTNEMLAINRDVMQARQAD